VSERLAEPGVTVDVNQQRRQMDLRKSSCGRLGEVLGFGGYLLGGQRRDDQITVLD
jgi:hypothetical protein